MEYIYQVKPDVLTKQHLST